MPRADRRRGGSLYREAALADRVERALGQRIALPLVDVYPGFLEVPLELDPGGLEHAPGRLRELGAGAVARDERDSVCQGTPFGYLLDCSARGPRRAARIIVPAVARGRRRLGRVRDYRAGSGPRSGRRPAEASLRCATKSRCLTSTSASAPPTNATSAATTSISLRPWMNAWRPAAATAWRAEGGT